MNPMFVGLHDELEGDVRPDLNAVEFLRHFDIKRHGHRRHVTGDGFMLNRRRPMIGEISRRMPCTSKVLTLGSSAAFCCEFGLQPTITSNRRTQKRCVCFIKSFSQAANFFNHGGCRVRVQAIEEAAQPAMRIHQRDAVGVGKIARHGTERVVQVRLEKTGRNQTVKLGFVAGQQQPAVGVRAEAFAVFGQRFRACRRAGPPSARRA